jgi:hypothetical protein
VILTHLCKTQRRLMINPRAPSAPLRVRGEIDRHGAAEWP